MLGYHVYQSVQLVTYDEARSALPDAPVRPEPARGERGVALRARASLALRRLADAVEPTREVFEPAPVGGSRSSNR